MCLCIVVVGVVVLCVYACVWFVYVVRVLIVFALCDVVYVGCIVLCMCS